MGYGKEDFCPDLFVDTPFAALFAYRDYYDLLFHRSKGVGQLDRILHETVFVTVYYRHAPFADECVVNTVTIALIAATASTLLGSITAIGIFNLKARSRKAISFVNSIPILNGDIITGISLFLLFVSLGISQGYTTVVLAHITFCTPYVVLSVLPRLKQMNPNIYEAALDLGATPMQALRKVIIPEIRPGMISGFMLALTLSIDDFAVTVFTIGNEGLETLSTYIYADARKGGLTPELRPLSTIIFVVVLALLIVINRRAGKEKK